VVSEKGSQVNEFHGSKPKATISCQSMNNWHDVLIGGIMREVILQAFLHEILPQRH